MERGSRREQGSRSAMQVWVHTYAALTHRVRVSTPTRRRSLRPEFGRSFYLLVGR
jgi:hypothetical protein